MSTGLYLLVYMCVCVCIYTAVHTYICTHIWSYKIMCPERVIWPSEINVIPWLTCLWWISVNTPTVCAGCYKASHVKNSGSMVCNAWVLKMIIIVLLFSGRFASNHFSSYPYLQQSARPCTPLSAALCTAHLPDSMIHQDQALPSAFLQLHSRTLLQGQNHATVQSIPDRKWHVTVP